MNRRLIVKSILWFFVAFGLTAGILRFKSGLGATTGLNDATPWGIWIGFDVMSGVALAAGGFVMAGTVYIFHLERYRPLVRPAVLTAFLGYIIVAIGLIFDLGLPWNIWHPMIFWQPQSVLFEVAMCVMLYSTVLALEVAPIVLEHRLFKHPLFQKAYKILKKATIPLVILGIMLSTLHQSSLGSLFLLAPGKTHPLWYSPLVYVIYFVSAISLGLAMVIFESSITSWVYAHKPKVELLRGLGRACSLVLLLYVTIRLADLYNRGILPTVLNGSWQSNLFIFEIVVSALLPALLFHLKKIHSHITGLFLVASMVVFGFVLHRMNTSIITFARPDGVSYFPTVAEIGITMALVSGAVLVFFFFVENFNLFGDKEEPTHQTGEQDFDSAQVYIGKSLYSNFAVISAFVVIAIGAAFALLPKSAVYGFKYPDTPVFQAVGWEVMKIDGNRAREFTMFPHSAHIEKIGTSKADCQICHHMSLKLTNNNGILDDGPTPCFRCHSDMYLEKSIFDHPLHQKRLGGNKSCEQCHVSSKSAEVAKNCSECHREMFPIGKEANYMAVSYLDAMHGICKKCHEETALRENREQLGQCANCHDQQQM